MKCLNCDHENHPGAQYCAKCGKALQKKNNASEGQNCPRCHTKNRPGVRFCAHCGEAMQPSAEKPAESPARPKARLPRLDPALTKIVDAAEPEKRCPQCNTQNHPQARFCRKCGGALQTPVGQSAEPVQPEPAANLRHSPALAPEETLLCPQCLAGNKPSARFCVKCGHILQATSHAEHSQAPQETSGGRAFRAGQMLRGALSRKWGTAQWLTTLLVAALVAWWAYNASSPQVSRQEAIEMSHQRIVSQYPALVGIEPTITTHRNNGELSYTIEYQTQNAAGLPSRLVFIINADTGTTLLLGSQ